jgi:sensor histidine kinase YesM
MPFSSDTRQAVRLTAATWVLSGTLFLIPFQLFQGGPTAPMLLVVLNICLAGALLSTLVYVTAKRLRGRSAAIRFTGMAAATLGASALLAACDALISNFIYGFFDPVARQTPVGLRALNNFIALIWQFALLAAVYTVLEANNLARTRERELAEARAAAAQAMAAAQQAQLAALRFQLNPHFLFNTLNAISSLIITDRTADAETMTSKLSGFLRASLEADPESEVTLDEELETIQSYLDIETVRFGERLKIAFECPAPLLDALVPSFLLQPVIENAVKYAVGPSRRPVAITVKASTDGDRLWLKVEDDGGQAFGALPKGGTGLGLANIRQRLHAFYGEAGTLDATATDRGFTVLLGLPYRRERNLQLAAE